MNWPPSLRTLLKGIKTGSCINSNEQVVFFPTVACRTGSDGWRLPVHGWIYRPSELSRLRRVALHVVKRVLRLKVKRSDPNMPLFRQRMGALLADNQPGQRIRIRIGNGLFTLKKSHANGHFHGHVDLSESQITCEDSAAGRWLSFHALTKPGDPRTFDGRILLLPDRGLSVISDIDDTIKITEVTDRRRLLNNTFLNAFASVPDMANLYQHLHKTRNAAFHYVSACPWHLYPCLAEFLTAQEFPAGSFHMRNFRLAGRDLPTAFRSSSGVKSLHIKNLLVGYPRRTFILIGDSGESDPEMYAHFARRHPQQIEKIFIRNITGEPVSAKRWTKIFAKLPSQKWQLFTTANELKR